jgi:hypothetical protein
MTLVATRSVAPTSDRIFYTGMAAAIALTVFAGFAPTYFLKTYFGSPPLTPLVHAHGLAFTGWLLLFFTQTVLIANRRIDLHRKLGILGIVLASTMIVLGVATAIGSIRTNHTPPGLDPRSFLALPFFDILTFAILVGAGITLRKRPETHKRLMLLATIAMLDAAIARLPGLFPLGPIAFFGVQDLFVLAGPVYDFASRRRIDPAYLWGGLLLLLSQPVRLLVSQTPLWLAFGDWLKG